MDWHRLKPRYWIQVGPTCPVWDSILSKALAEYDVADITQHTCTIGPLTVWIENWPYGYGKSHGNGFPDTGLPKVGTRKRLRRAIQNALVAKVMAWPGKSRLKIVQ
jgi:hypothetical protein